jgi:hypothetical protein
VGIGSAYEKSRLRHDHYSMYPFHSMVKYIVPSRSQDTEPDEGETAELATEGGKKPEGKKKAIQVADPESTGMYPLLFSS